MAKISKVTCLVLVVSMLLLAACKKRKGRSINAGELNYTLEVLSDDTMDNFSNATRSAFEVPEDFPAFAGPKRIEALTDTSVKIYFDALSKKNFPPEWQDQNPYYFVWVRNNAGKYELKKVKDVEPDYPFQENYILVEQLTPDSLQSVQIVLGIGSYLGFNRRAINFRMNNFPNPPRTVEIVNSRDAYTSMISADPRPTLRVRRYEGNVSKVKFFLDRACTHEIGETSELTKRYFTLTLETPLPVGEYRFYAKYYNSLGNSSSCSTAYAHYTVVDCPEDYVLVPPEETLGTPAFCLMKTEARQGANDVAVPGYQEYPWETTPQEAKDACRRVAPNCDIITNLEWMATARHLAKTASNWLDYLRWFSPGNIGTNSVLNISDPSDLTGGNYRQFAYLPAGILWDFGGNLAEWADNAEEGGAVFQPITNTCPQGPFELEDPEFSCPELDPRYYTPFNPTGHTLSHGTNYVGKIVGPLPADRNSATPIAAARGGQVNDINNSGIYALFMFNHMTDTGGFRCVCHL